MQLDPSLEAQLEKLRATIASGDWMGQKMAVRGPLLAGFLWTDIGVKDVLGDKMSWQDFQRVYRGQSHLFMRWVQGETSFVDALAALFEAHGLDSEAVREQPQPMAEGKGR